MTAAAAFPAAAQRLMRSAAASRALRVGLFVGALFVLALLFGGRAQAADGAPELRDAVTSTTEPATTETVMDPATASVPEPRVEPEPSAEPARATATATEATATATKAKAKATATNPVTATERTATERDTAKATAAKAATANGTAAKVAASTTQRTLDETRSLVRSAVGELTRTVTSSLGGLAEDAARAWPEPRFPRPSLPGLDLPGPGDSAPLPGPDGSAPQDREPGTRAGAAAHKARPDSAYPLGYWSGVVAVHDGGGQDAAAGRDARRQQPQSPSEVPHRPYGIAAQAASDGGSQRHGEVHAATPSSGPAFRLVPGAGAAAAYFPTRERHRDILEFPG
ncbi:hypothetical protein [Streptomyces boluensis]|uniref:Uncharacterized protein n=1 Tax=Streptomyces boluensis TaxID=1775135 RepID=A0A964XLE8_9ACTN|nr:hypothetical protein [Streptomyces boluensis]NBE53379.1 hypothetical protein [Streptomyces boluensis]